MYGAVFGDIAGSQFEFSETYDRRKEFSLFSSKCRFTDDTVMTVALADALLRTGKDPDEKEFKNTFIDCMHEWGNTYIDAGYGGTFYRWLRSRDRKPYNSWGNGSAMRVSPVGWLCDTLEDTLRLAQWSAEVTHDHPEGIKGAQAVAATIFLARIGMSKDEIKSFVKESFGYDLDRTVDSIRPGYSFDVSCQGSVPESIISFLEGESLTDTVRNAVSLGGDTDTMGAISGSIGQAFWGMDDSLKACCDEYLPSKMRDVLKRFEKLTGADAYAPAFS